MLLNTAREWITSQVAELGTNEGFMPVMLVERPNGEFTFIGMDMPGEEGKADAADMMTAIVAAHRATEVVFFAVSWAAMKAPGESHVPPSEHLDRRKVVLVVHVCRDGSATYNIPLTQENGTASLGEWQHLGAGDGRFINAIRKGMMIGAGMPPAMAKFFDDALDGPEGMGTVIANLIRGIREIRTAAATPEGRERIKTRAEEMRADLEQKGLL